MAKHATTKHQEIPSPDPDMDYFRVGSSGVEIAVRLHGTLRDDEPPVLILPGYVRNMVDFDHLPAALNRHPQTDFTFILADLAGRGRSGRLPRGRSYSSIEDADCILDLMTALDIPRAVFAGEGHGGQIAMLVAQRRPGAVAGTILIDAGPVTDPRGLVRTRNNFHHLMGLRGEKDIRPTLRKILGTDYPGESPARLDALAARLYGLDAKGRLSPHFDPRLVDQLDKFDFDDVLEPQWALFDCLSHAPLMIVHTQLSDQLRRATHGEMARRRPDAATLTIAGQGSPALLESGEEQTALVEFLRSLRDHDGPAQD